MKLFCELTRKEKEFTHMLMLEVEGQNMLQPVKGRYFKNEKKDKWILQLNSACLGHVDTKDLGVRWFKGSDGLNRRIRLERPLRDGERRI